MATTRVQLRTAITYKTDQRLTLEADQDYYLNLGDLQVIRKWIRFDSGRFRKALQVIATDASGVLEFPAGFTTLEYLEDTTGKYYPMIDVRERRYKTGYYFLQYDQATNVDQIQIIENGTDKATTNFNVFDLQLLQMASAGTGQPAIPEEYRDSVATAGAMLYFQNQGPSFQDFADSLEARFNREMKDAYEAYKITSRDPRVAETVSADAGGNGSVEVHTVT